jgi:uncharacterized protein DUF1360
VSRLQALSREYGAPDAPLGAYAGLVAGFLGAGTALAAAAARRKTPDRLAAGDIALAAFAAHRISRLVTKDRVTSVFRAPFTEYEGTGAPGEVEEHARRSSGPALALCQLLTCPYCIGEWAALGLTAGFTLAPRPTRALATVLTVATAADVMQEIYVRLAPSE